MVARDFITKDFGWKLLSLALAIGIWLTVSAVSRQGTSTNTNNPGTRTMERIFSRLPLNPVSADSDVRDYKLDPEAVEVIVSGPKDMISALTEKEIHATVNLTGFTSNSDRKRRVDVSTPPNVTLISAKPSQVNVLSPVAGNQPE